MRTDRLNALVIGLAAGLILGSLGAIMLYTSTPVEHSRLEAAQCVRERNVWRNIAGYFDRELESCKNKK